MTDHSFTRRDFIRISAGAAALGVVPHADALTDAMLSEGSKAEESDVSRKLGMHEEMSAADAWAQSFRLPTPASMTSTSKLLPEVLKPPFSFIYGDRPSSEFLSAWKFDLRNSEVDETKRQQETIYTDPQSGLVVRCVVTVFKDFPAVEWTIYFKNNGSADTPILQNIQALDAVLSSPESDPTIHYAKGAACSMSDFMPMTRVLGNHGQMRLQPGGGRSSSQFLPFFNLETKGEGAIMAIGWSGEWAAEFDHPGTSKNFHVKAGLDLTHLKLHPGEEIRTPKMLMLFWQGEHTRGHNMLRQFILRHHRPKVDGKPVLTPITNHNWGATTATSHLENIRQIIAHDLPMDYYWIDAEWFGNGEWWRNVGNWEANKKFYPQGLKPLSDLLHSGGRKLLLWFEPERVCEGTPWYTEHAPWLLDVPKEKRVYRGFGAKGDWDVEMTDPRWIPNESGRNQIQENDRLFNLAIPEARQFLTNYMSDKIDEFGLDCFRNDSNIAPLEFWRAADAPDRQGMTEIKWIEGLYAFWDELLQRHPHLIIDDCASGGRRIDLETIGRSTALSRTDFVGDRLADQCHTFGLLKWVPLNTTLGESLTTKNEYRIRSSMSAGLSYGLFAVGDNPQGKTDYASFPFSEIKKSLDQYCSVQKYFYGDYYTLTEYTQNKDAWMAYQLDLPDQGEGLIVVIKRPLSDYRQAAYPLHALRQDAMYEVTNLDSGESVSLSGKVLLEKGVETRLLNKPDSTLLRYRRKS